MASPDCSSVASARAAKGKTGQIGVRTGAASGRQGAGERRVFSSAWSSSTVLQAAGCRLRGGVVRAGMQDIGEGRGGGGGGKLASRSRRNRQVVKEKEGASMAAPANGSPLSRVRLRSA